MQFFPFEKKPFHVLSHWIFHAWMWHTKISEKYSVSIENSAFSALFMSFTIVFIAYACICTVNSHFYFTPIFILIFYHSFYQCLFVFFFIVNRMSLPSVKKKLHRISKWQIMETIEKFWINGSIRRKLWIFNEEENYYMLTRNCMLVMANYFQQNCQMNLVSLKCL